MKKLGLVLTLAAACVGGLLGAAPAGAAISCSYSSGSHDVTIAMTANGDSVYIKRSGTAIQANFANCGAATVTNTHHIVVNGSAGAQSVSIDLGAGAFEPGNDGESSTPEIEF